MGTSGEAVAELDNKKFTPIGETFITSAGFWKGSRLGLYSYNEKTDGGVAAFNWFRFDYDGPKGVR